MAHYMSQVNYKIREGLLGFMEIEEMQENVCSRGGFRCDFCYGEKSDELCMSGSKLKRNQQTGVICFGCIVELIQKVYEGKVKLGDSDSPTVCGICDETSENGFLNIWCRESSGICTNCITSFLEAMLYSGRKQGAYEF